jgi:hypothetical protein
VVEFVVPNPQIMDETEAIDFLIEAVHAAHEDYDELPDMRTFEEACLMTSNKGFVMRMPDGSEFQVQVIRSK